MTDYSLSSAVEIGELQVSLADVLRRWHQRGRLLPLLEETAVERLLQQRAAEAGLAVPTEALQQAADAFRRRQGLTSAEETRAWLARQRLTAELFEEALEHDLLVDQLKDHLTRDRVADHFATHQGEYARVRLRQIVVAREDLARELLTQIQEEGQDFADLARAHSQHPSSVEGGLLGWVLRRALPPSVAEAVFTAREGAVVGPLTTDQGFQLLLVEAFAPPQLDAAASAAIRDELFGAWLSEQLQTRPLAFPLLDVL